MRFAPSLFACLVASWTPSTCSGGGGLLLLQNTNSAAPPPATGSSTTRVHDAAATTVAEIPILAAVTDHVEDASTSSSLPSTAVDFPPPLTPLQPTTPRAAEVGIGVGSQAAGATKPVGRT